MSSSAIPGSQLWSPFGSLRAADPYYHLQSHVRRCLESRGRLFELRCIGELVRGAVAPRFITTLAGVLVLGYAASALL